MNIKDFKFIQGSAQKNEVATIKFTGPVNAETVGAFVGEFAWLEHAVRPSKIRILINSEGGSVLRGMNAFNAIIDCTVPTETVVDGLAASMGSVLLAAGDVAKMRDYGYIMIHNPFKAENPDDPMVIAFKNQLKSIYKTRWGFKDAQITEIMDGKGDEDGTYLDAKAAVKLGIIAKENIIKTAPQKKAEILAAIDGVEAKSDWVDVFASIELDAQDDANKQSDQEKPTINKGDINPENNNLKEDNMVNPDLIVAELKLSKEATQTEVLAKIVDLNGIEAKVADLVTTNTGLAETNATLTTEKLGLETSLSNVQATLVEKETELGSVTAELDVFKQKEIDAVKAEQNTFIEAAITAGKILAESKEQWLTIAGVNFEACKATINAIVGKTKISKEIEVQATLDLAAKGGQKTEAELKAEKEKDEVVAVVGEDFKMQTLQD